MIPSRERASHCVAGALSFALSLGSAASLAQDAGVWPARTIQIIVPYTPGTGADILSRILGPKLAERWKIGVVTDNRAGASGNIGTDFVAKSAPDGYTLLCTATSFGTNPAINQTLPFDRVKSFAPVILLATSTMAVIVTQGPGAGRARDGDMVGRLRSGRDAAGGHREGKRENERAAQAERDPRASRKTGHGASRRHAGALRRAREEGIGALVARGRGRGHQGGLSSRGFHGSPERKTP